MHLNYTDNEHLLFQLYSPDYISIMNCVNDNHLLNFLFNIYDDAFFGCIKNINAMNEILTNILLIIICTCMNMNLLLI